MPEVTENDLTPEPSRSWSKLDLLAGLACMIVGLLLAIAPHLATLASRGTLDYLADHDDVLYLSIARAPYHGEWTLRDPFARKSDAMPTIYPWAQFVPFTLPARWLGLGPLKISLVWRIIGGPLLGGSLFVLFRRLLGETKHPTAWALGASLICLSDAGFVGGRTLVEGVSLVPHLAGGTTPLDKPDALGQYRVVTPLLNLPFLLLLVAAVSPSPGRGRWRGAAWTLFGAACLGLCFHLYFFYWTAAVPALIASALTGLVLGFRDTGRRSAEWARARSIGLVLAGGLALGLPQLVSNARTFADPEVRPILQRMGRGRTLDAHDPARTRYLGNTWAWAKVVLGGLAILRFRLRGLGPAWWFTFFGFAMANSALVTGLEFENFHWSYVHSAMGEILLLAIGARLFDRSVSRGRNLAMLWLWLLPVALLALAFAWRPFEALHAPDSTELSQLLDEIRGLEPTLARFGPDQLLAGPSEVNVALLFTRSGLLYQEPHSYLSSLLPDESVHERHALNAWLRNFDLPMYRGWNDSLPFRVVPSGDTSRWSPEAAAARREAIFRSMEKDNGGAIYARYHPDVFFHHAGAGARTIGDFWWTKVGGNNHWQIWVAEPVNVLRDR